MTDWKKAKRARNKAGYVHVQGYTTASSALSIAEKLMSAEEVDRRIAGKEERDGEA